MSRKKRANRRNAVPAPAKDAGARGASLAPSVHPKSIAGSLPRFLGTLLSVAAMFAVAASLHSIWYNPDTPAKHTAYELQARSLSAQTHESAEGLPSVEEMAERLALRLYDKPNDPEGWRMLGWSYAGLERFADAAAAYEKAVKLKPLNARLSALLGEAIIKADGGRVTARSEQIVRRALELDAEDIYARYYLGLALRQRGDAAAALAEWSSIRAGIDDSDGSLTDLEKQISELKRELDPG